MSLGDHIQKIRLKKGISQQFIADSIGISQSKFNRIENGKSDVLLNELFQICQELRINYIELLQSNHSSKDKTADNEIEISYLCIEVESLKSQLSEIKEFIYASRKRGGVKYLLTNFSKVQNFGKGYLIEAF
jgi:transcriptional regulator with XRE-family HTH domain